MAIMLTGSILVAHSPARADLTEMSYRLVPGMTSTVGADIGSLSASGQLIVWEDFRDEDPDVYVYRLNDGRESRVLNTSEIRRSPAVSESAIVWVQGDEPDRRTIQGLDLAEGTEFEVSSDPFHVAGPTISSDMIAWQERVDDRWIIQVSDRTGDAITTLGEDAANSGRPDAEGQRIVWQEHDGNSWNVHQYDAESGTSSAVANTEHDDQYPVIGDNHIVFVRSPIDGGQPQLIATAIDSGEEQVLVSEHFVQRPSIHGSLVVWEDWRSGLPDIYAWDLSAGETFAVARSQQANAPVVSESIVAWVSGNDLSRQRVQGLEIQERLPTDPHDPPAVPSPDRLYIPETQQFVAGGFKSFWQANGGPQIFGFPLTTEFTEQHPETGEEIVVQYFERVKLEYHPEAPEDNRIRLALLGYEQRPENETEPVEPFENTEVSRYFPETGYGISFGFKEFWEQNGGLELFGFPITGEFNENGRTVQYFERARFEFDPESETSEVSLGLLGREALQDRGWLPPPPLDTTQIFE